MKGIPTTLNDYGIYFSLPPCDPYITKELITLKTPEGFKKVDAPTVVKLDKVGMSLKGDFVSIEESGKFADSYGVNFIEGGKDARLVFVSKQAKTLFERSGIKQGQKFVLGILEEKTAEKSGMKYWVYELFVE